MGKRARGLALSRRVMIVAGVAVVALLAGTGTVLANSGGWFGSGGDNDWP
jgi:hypothetical protein